MSSSDSVETTHELVELVRTGDTGAQNRLLERYLPVMTRWAHGRLPGFARDLNDTADLVQMTLLRAFQSLPTFHSQGKGAFYGFLRTVLQNLLRDEIRRGGRLPGMGELQEDIPDPNESALGVVMSMELLEGYEKALTRLDPATRDIVIMRVELGFSHEDIARIAECPSANAARMRVARALAQLAEEMQPFRQS